MILRLNELDDARLKPYVSLTDIQLRNRLEPQLGVFVAESLNVIERVVEGNAFPLSLLTDERHLESARPLIAVLEAANTDFEAYVLPNELLERLIGYELTRGVLAAFRRPELAAVDELLSDARRVVVLDDITNHTNVGAIFRSAAALGADAVLVTPTCHDPLYRRALRVSMGTVFQVPWTYIGVPGCPWTEAGIPLLHEIGFVVAALALTDASVSLDEAALDDVERLALVLGTEGDGLSKRTIEACDMTVRIPMDHGVDSLNVAAASAVALYAARPSGD